MPNTSTGEESVAQQLRDPRAVSNGFGLLMPNFVPRRYKPKNITSWSGHLAFASELIQAIRPEIIVELGTHWGEAYFTFCQTVEEHRIGSLCYAVDHWLGDEHAGRYGEEVFENVRTHNERFYRQFSYLLRMSFDEALSQFADNSIDLLHVDGFHTYEAASHDFHTWLPKVKEGGVVLLHDICPKHENFGVWRLWDEIKAEFPNTFEFHHGWGLGVVQKGNRDSDVPLLDYLFSHSPQMSAEIRRRYIIYASHLENLLKPTETDSGNNTDLQPSTEIRVQVFPFGTAGYSEDAGLLQKTKTGVWETLEFELPQGLGEGPLRIDPSHEPSLIQIREMALFTHPAGAPVWSFSAEGENAVTVDGTAALLPCSDGLLVSSFGDDPQVILPVPNNAQSPVKLRLQLRVMPTPAPAPEVIGGVINNLNEAVKNENDRLTDGLRRSNTEKDQAEAKRAAAEELLRATETELRAEQRVRGAMEASLSWRVTAPIRKIMMGLRSGRRREP
jgi:Methyltransferase domain